MFGILLHNRQDASRHYTVSFAEVMVNLYSSVCQLRLIKCFVTQLVLYRTLQRQGYGLF